jgi:O-antigen/teichoic acid export membrane protein
MIAGFFELGAASTMVKFVSSSLSKNRYSKAKAYFNYLLKIKIVLVILASSILIISARFIADNYYQKPIYLALLAGSFYILFTGFIGFFSSLFQSANNFKVPFFQEIFLQVIRIIVLPLVILYSINKTSSNDTLLFIIILTLAIVYLFASLFLIFFYKKEFKIFSVEKAFLTKKEKKEVNRFLIILSSLSLSGLFFGYIDLIVLGRYVAGEFLGFYQAALGIIGAFLPIITLSSVLFPIFSRMKNERLEEGFSRSMKLNLFISLIVFLGIFIFAYPLIWIIYGKDYFQAMPFLRILAFMVIISPLNSVYSSYFSAKGKPEVMAKLLVVFTIINIILNLVAIHFLIKMSQHYAVLGVCIVTVVVNATYSFALFFSRRKDLAKLKDIKTNK